VSLCVCVVGNDFRVIPDTNWTGAGVLPLLKPYPLENKTKKHDCHSFFLCVLKMAGHVDEILGVSNHARARAKNDFLEVAIVE
jgi:hypothetical protein